ncbi:phage holin family protein [Gulosibacter molinativorax]|uniref:Phage holin family protein n=1 Tax=Gulosibacter molinativorax TaxID=256821 RepID=A0ABT7C957_9MICO|nr:phage holin family protein [Gulosibacter molinativorax]MDJ1371738.1 phage holin family protein [Gulosibacter molinativorax]QUY63160.1 Conserved membrane protein [Gulosibacter molinativorax]
MRLIASIVLNAIALWLTTLILSGGITVTAYENTTAALVVTYLLLALVWGLVNSIIGRVVRFVSMPLYCLTLGLFAFVVNGFLFWLVAWLSDLAGFGITVDNFWWAMGGAILMGIFSAILNGLFNGRDRREEERD